MSQPMSIPILAINKQLAGDENWLAWKESVISLLHGKGLLGYPTGEIPKPSDAASLRVTAATAINSLHPSLEEWLLRDSQAEAIIYQNIKEPRSHDLNATDPSEIMWTHLKTKFNRASDVLKGIALDEYRAAKLTNSRLMPQHLDTLRDLKDEYIRKGGSITDREERAIIIQSLPMDEFGPSLLTLQDVKDVPELKIRLLQWWDARWKKVIAAEQAAVPNALATAGNPSISTGAVTCDNCHQVGHATPNCWAKGGAKEGRGPRWWIAPPGYEPRPEYIEATRKFREARRNAMKTAAAMGTTTATPSHTPIPTPNLNIPTPNPAETLAAATSIELYAIDDLTNSMSTSCFSNDNTQSRASVSCGQSPSLLSAGASHSVCLVSNVAAVSDTVLNANAGHPTYLDSAATETFFADKDRFVSFALQIYRERLLTIGVGSQSLVKE
jgi:hypothetical protein